MRAWTRLGLAGAVLTLAAPGAGAQRAPCTVHVVDAPAEVRAEIEAWVRAEPRCDRTLEVRVVTTPEGLALWARDEAGHVRERLVPDAQSAAVLVVSWMAAEDGARDDAEDRADDAKDLADDARDLADDARDRADDAKDRASQPTRDGDGKLARRAGHAGSVDAATDGAGSGAAGSRRRTTDDGARASGSMSRTDLADADAIFVDRPSAATGAGAMGTQRGLTLGVLGSSFDHVDDHLGIRGQLDLLGGPRWTLGVALGWRAVAPVPGDDGDMRSNRGIGTTLIVAGLSHAIGPVTLRGQLGAGLEIAPVTDEMHEVAQRTITPVVDAALLAGVRLHDRWDLVAGPIVDAPIASHGALTVSAFVGARYGL